MTNLETNELKIRKQRRFQAVAIWACIVFLTVILTLEFFLFYRQSIRIDELSGKGQGIVNIDSLQRIRANYLIDCGETKYLVYNFPDSTTVVVVGKSARQIELKIDKENHGKLGAKNGD